MTSYLWYAGFITSVPLSKFDLVPPIFVSFRANAFFYLAVIRRFVKEWHLRRWIFYDNHRKNTPVDVLKFTITVHEQAQSNRSCNICFAIVLLSAFFSFFSVFTKVNGSNLIVGGETQRMLVSAYSSRNSHEHSTKIVHDYVQLKNILLNTMSGIKGDALIQFCWPRKHRGVLIYWDWKKTGVAKDNGYVFHKPNHGPLESLRSSLCSAAG